MRLPVHENTIADILLQIYTNKTKSEQKEEIFAKKETQKVTQKNIKDSLISLNDKRMLQKEWSLKQSMTN